MRLSLQNLEAGAALLEVARTRIAWGRICLQRGMVNPAREHFEKAAIQFEVSGLERELAETRNLIAGVHVA